MEDNRDSDTEDLLNNLLGNDDDSEEEAPKNPALKELDFNFLDHVDEAPENGTKKQDKNSSLVHDCDSSDDEDRRNFEAQKYSECGRDIRDLMKKQEFDKGQAASKPNNGTAFAEIAEKVKKNTFPDSPKQTPQVNKNPNAKTGPLSEWLNRPPDIYTDPVFGLRIVKPLVSSTDLKDRMKDRTAVTVSKVKHFISTQNLENDWAIAGVVIYRSGAKKSQNGNAYCFWTISDLTEKMNTVTMFLFKNAYKLLWKTTEGTVVGILNPSVLESRNDKDQATLSVDVAQKVMVLGNSRDMGRCKSKKKSGEPCTNIVNINKCEFCTYHVQFEYSKASRRQDLQTDRNNRRFGNSFDATPKNSTPGIYSQGGHQNMLAIPAKRNLKYEKKDSDRLALLMGQSASSDNNSDSTKVKSLSAEERSAQAKEDLEKLKRNRGWNSKSLQNIPAASNIPVLSSLKPTSSAAVETLKPSPSLNIPRLGYGLRGNTIDFSEPITKTHINSAKLNAIKWVQQKGGLKKTNPNKIRESKEKIAATAKRRREEEENEEEPKPKKINGISEQFKELLEAKSAHTDLIDKADDEEKEKYFKKLEAKERMEEKMINTNQVACKAVKCLVCQYTSFSAADICKEKRHALRIFDAMKSFFKCSDCGNRTVSLDRIPSHSCKKCSGSNWLRTGMMNEKKMGIPGAALSIRGGEQKFVGSDITDFSLNLLVPESES